MDRQNSMGQPVMAQSQTRSHSRFVYGSLAGLTGALLAAAFIAPFYGALDGPVQVITSDGDAAKPNGGSGNGIVVEQFDYNEPDSNADAKTQTPPAGDQQNAPSGNSSDEANGLQREAPRPPLSDLGLAASPKPPEPVAPTETSTQPLTQVGENEDMQLLQRPVAVAAGRLESQGRLIDLQGIEVVPVEQTCQTAAGESWPCGMQARTAFRQWLRSRAIMCRLPQNDSGAAIATACKLGNDDAAEWLVTNGWAKAAPDGAYADAGRKAEDARLGIFGDKPDASLQSLEPDPGNGLNNPSPLAPETEPQPSSPSPQQGEFPPAPAAPTPAPAN